MNFFDWQCIVSGLLFVTSFVIWIAAFRKLASHKRLYDILDDDEDVKIHRLQRPSIRKSLNRCYLMIFGITLFIMLAQLVLLAVDQPDHIWESGGYYIVVMVLMSASWFLVFQASNWFEECCWYLPEERLARPDATRLSLFCHPSVVLYFWLFFGACCFNMTFDVLKQIAVIVDKASPLGGSFISASLIDGALVMFSAYFLSASTWIIVRAKRGYLPLPEPVDKSVPTFWHRLRVLTPFMWPKRSFRLQCYIFICMLLLVLGRVVNLYGPITYKNVVDDLTGTSLTLPVTDILINTLVRWLQGPSGVIETIQSTLWIPVEQYTTKQLSTQMFQHLHSLSLRWHLNRKTGEVLRVLDRGNQAITSLLSYLYFNIFPVIADIIIATIFFMATFNASFGLLLLVTMVLYLIVTIMVTEWRTKYRREMINLDNKVNTRAVDSLLNFETVKYFTNEEFETASYRDQIDMYQRADWKSQISLKVLNFSQNFVILLGSLVGGLWCAKDVVEGRLTVGDFVLFSTYLMQLYRPLNFFGTYYRMIQQNFIDMEKLLTLMKEEAEVTDAPNAKALVLNHGDIVFENVTFSYSPLSEPTLKNVSFKIPGGTSFAIVGETGSGKSSLLHLLFRFYDPQQGRILVDHQDIRFVTQRSLRELVAVVPQDTVLFNDTLKYNVQYAKPSCSDAEINEALQSAVMSDTVANFPSGLETMVGERGLRLSGGEKQRVSAARAILKNAPIVILDEATSALDTATESKVMTKLVSRDKTTVMVAHRLSTVVNCDWIIVLKRGEIVEQGSHASLLQKDGLYADMWRKQSDSRDQQ